MHFRKLRETESLIPTEVVVVISLDTQDGGKAGRITEVSRFTAAQLIVGGRARLATDTEIAQFRSDEEHQRAMADQATRAQMQVAVLSEADLRALKSSLKLQKG
jgi:hypothetical protein